MSKLLILTHKKILLRNHAPCDSALLTLNNGCGNRIIFIFKGIPASPKISAFESDILHILRSMATDVYQSLFFISLLRSDTLQGQ